MSKPRKYLDWTRNPDISSLTPFQQFVRNVDWTKSLLGPIEAWSDELRQMVCIIMADPSPAVVYWGEEMTIVYNEAYTKLIGQKHPGLQGGDPRVGFAEIWDRFDPILRHGMETGQTVIEGHQPLLLDRYGFLEETYFSWKFIPVIGKAGHVVGSYATTTEASQEVINERRMSSISRLGHKIARASNAKDIWTHFLDTTETNDKDLPIILAYSTRNDSSHVLASAPQSKGRTQCRIEGSRGMPVSRDCMVARDFILDDGSNTLSALFANAVKLDHPLVVRGHDIPEFMKGEDQWRGFGDPCTTAVICLIRSLSSDMPAGFVMIGLNPHRQYDQDYENYIYSIVAQITTPNVLAILKVEEVRRNLQANSEIPSQHVKQSKELKSQGLTSEQDSMPFSSFAERVPVGFAVIDCLLGEIMYANSAWFEVTGIDPAETSQLAWLNAVLDEDVPKLASAWEKLVIEKTVVQYVARFKKPWQDENGEVKSTFSTGLCTGYPEFDKEGNVKTIVSVIMPMNERIWFEEQLILRTKELEVSNAKYRTFADSSPIGVASLKPNGQVDYANSAWERITNQRIDDEAMAWMSAIYVDDQARVQEYFEALLESKQLRTIETRLNRAPGPDGENADVPLWVIASAYTELDADGQVEKIVCWLTDISALKAAEVSLEKRIDEALAMKKRQETFIDMTSHEIRNPLSAVMHCAEEIMMTLDDCSPFLTNGDHHGVNGHVASVVSNTIPESLRSIRDAAQTISLCVQHQRNIVDDVLTLSKLDSDLLHISLASVRPSKIVQEALKMFEAERKEAGISLEFMEDKSMADLSAEWLLLDSSRVLQVFINLITNAIKFTRGCDTKSIIVKMSASVEKPTTKPGATQYLPCVTGKGADPGQQWPASETIYMRLSVEDTGCGLSSDECKKLFNRFSQGSPKTHVKYGGSGLGLWISRQIVELMGGEIGLHSEKGRGSKFEFFVKTTRAPTPTPQSASAAEKPFKIQLENMIGHTDTSTVDRHDAESRSTSARRISITKLSMRILVVEDNLVNQKVLSKQLRRYNHLVEVANNGVEALDAIKKTTAWKANSDGSERSYDIVLMDVEMPVMNGLTCVRQIRDLEASGSLIGHLPVIAVTANVRTEQVEHAIDSGMDDITTKPYKIQDILTQIQRAYLLKV